MIDPKLYDALNYLKKKAKQNIEQQFRMQDLSAKLAYSWSNGLIFAINEIEKALGETNQTDSS